MRKGVKAIDWHLVDWSKSNYRLARALDCSEYAVALWRRKYKGRDSSLLGAAKRIPWKRLKIDWSQPNTEIAAKYGICKLSVYVRRLKEGRPPWSPVIPLEQYQIDWSKPTKELARLLNCSEGVISKRRAELGLPAPPIQTKYNWSKVNWKLNDSQIARLLDCTIPAVNIQRRKRGIAPVFGPNKGVLFKI